MRRWLVIGVSVLGLTSGFAVFSLGRGQDKGGERPAPTPEAPPARPAPPPTASVPSAHAAADEGTLKDFARLTPLERQMCLATQRGADWLLRANRSDGRFVHGYVPDLKVLVDGDHYLRQAAAAAALARAARYTGDERQSAVARQAILTLLLDTGPDAQNPKLRHTTLPSGVVNPLASAGLLVLAVSELPSPADDLLQQSEELCAFIASQQQADGSLRPADGPEDRTALSDPDAVPVYSGQALYGLLRSQRHRPAAWKLDVARRALPCYRSWCKAQADMVAALPWHTAAFAEAYLQTGEKPFADWVFETADRLCDLQYRTLDPRHPLWAGGFMGYADGKGVPSAPHIGSASDALVLADAYRAACRAGDVSRSHRYREALEAALQFLTTLQYTEAGTQHFADWYRPVLIGGFCASHQDGTLRIDYTAQAVGALAHYLAYVAGHHD